MVLVSTSCSENDNPVASPDPQVENPADVTIMIYGSGGGSLDRDMVNKIRKLYSVDSASYERVKVTVQFKFSQPEKIKGWQDEEVKKMFYETLEREGEEYVENNTGGTMYIRWMGAKGNSALRFVLDPKLTLCPRCMTMPSTRN